MDNINDDRKVDPLFFGQEITEEETKHFRWITDFYMMQENAYEIMRTGRVSWKIENETFNTLTNQGYHLGHNFGLGKKI